MLQKTKLENGIYFKPMQDQSTHFIAYKDGNILDPYDIYQFPNSHGFCQMFSFFIYIDNVQDFKKVKMTESTFLADELKKFVHNSFQCLQKIIKLLKNPKYKEVRLAFQKDFMNSKTTPRSHFGIKRGTTFEQFLSDLEKIPIEQVFAEMMENFEAYGKMITKKNKKKQFQEELENFYKSYEKHHQSKDKPNLELCVLPTEGETQYEAFQAIIANSFRAGKNSVYSKLLKKKNIKLIEEDIYKLVKRK